MKTMLVTKSSGLIGSEVVSYFFSKGWKIYIANNGLFRTLSIFKLLSEKGFSDGLS
jgi:nucleoside-diphosphate-sugar epimerase